MKTKVLAILVISTIISAIAIIWPRQSENQPVNIVVVKNLIPTLPHWIAMEKGFYEKNGIEPREFEFNSSSDAVSALEKGSCDYLPGVSTYDLIRSHQEKLSQPLIFSHCRLVADERFESLIVPSSSNISTIKDLEGKRIGVFPGQTSEKVVADFLSSRGVDISSVTFYRLLPPEHLPALQRGDIDCSHLYEPFRTDAIYSGGVRELYGSIYADLTAPKECAIGVSAFSFSFYNENRELANALIHVFNISVEFINQYPEEARRILATRLNLTHQVASNASWVNLATSAELDPECIHRVIEAYRRIGLIDQDYVLDSSFLYSK